MSFVVGDYEPVSVNFTDGMDDNVVSHTVNLAAGVLCAIPNVPLLVVFLTHKPFRGKYKFLIALAIADQINCLAIALMGANRVALYSRILATLSIPIRTPWECAVEPWLWLRGVGDLWPPVIQILMGIERISAVFFPSSFRHNFNRRSTLLVLLSIAVVAVALAVGFLLAWLRRREKAIYYCGRKEAFSDEYGTFIYITNIVAYTAGASLNTIAYVKAKQMTTTSLKKNKNIARLRCYLLISFISTILVSIPNFISLTNFFYKQLAKSISKPSSVLTALNSGCNLFVYIALNAEFSGRCVYLLEWMRHGGRQSTATGGVMYGGAGGGGGGGRRMVGGATSATASSVQISP